MSQQRGGPRWPRWPRPAGLALIWVVAAVGAIVIGLVAVGAVGAQLRARGPVGTDAATEPTPEPSAPVSLDPAGERRSHTFRDDFGSFTVACQGFYALGLEAAAAPGWRVVSYDRGPDDDVDAEFARGDERVDIEVYCHRGEPTLGEVERQTETDD